MKKQVYILLLILFGFFTTPTASYACSSSSTNSEKTCCSKKNSKTIKKDCCKNKHSKNQKDSKDCSGSCGNSSCSCPSISFGILFPFSEQVQNPVLIVSKKQSFHYTNLYFSSGFCTIWLPPKIN